MRRVYQVCLHIGLIFDNLVTVRVIQWKNASKFPPWRARCFNRWRTALEVKRTPIDCSSSMKNGGTWSQSLFLVVSFIYTLGLQYIWRNWLPDWFYIFLICIHKPTWNLFLLFIIDFWIAVHTLKIFVATHLDSGCRRQFHVDTLLQLIFSNTMVG